MIRQTKNYLFGALSGVTLIGIAIAAFVVIVSAQVFHEWPIAETGANATKSSVGAARALGVPAADQTGATAATGADPALRANAGRVKARAGGQAGRTHAGRRATPGDPAANADVSGPATAVESIPTTSSGGEEDSSSGGNTGSHSSQPSSPSSSSGGSPSTSNSSAPSSGGNASSGGSTGATGGSTGSSGSSGGSSGSSGGSTGVETPVTAGKTPTVAEGVDETVHGVDEAALGGTLEKTGVTEVTEGVVNGVVGSETPIGKTVEGVTEAVGGLLGGNGSSGE